MWRQKFLTGLQSVGLDIEDVGSLLLCLLRVTCDVVMSGGDGGDQLQHPLHQAARPLVPPLQVRGGVELKSSAPGEGTHNYLSQHSSAR